MNRRDYLHTLLGTSTVPTTADWKNTLNIPSDQDSKTTSSSLDEFVVTADDLGDEYEARRPKPKLYYDTADENLIGRKIGVKPTPWDDNKTLEYTAVASKAVTLRDNLDHAVHTNAVRERSIFYSYAFQPMSSETTPDDLHKLLLWKEFKDSEPGLEGYTDWVDTEFTEHTDPYRRTDIMVRAPIHYRPQSIQSDNPRPYCEASIVILTTNWGALGLSLDVEVVPDYGQSLNTLQSLADVLHTRSSQQPRPEIQNIPDADEEKNVS